MEKKIIISKEAQTRLNEIKSHKGENAFLRIEITSGGCAGMQINFTVENELQKDDIILDESTKALVIDTTSLELIAGATLNYERSLMGEKFSIVGIPNVQQKCGCGSSFAV